ncbi:hypothetical protein DFH07DRAFT_766259 [Mycena maculata]|uniref:Uncharacterized protein n=1 Tax=Mycena maculata TaxID=230809 RepID=A0AAD7K4L9_9AGAR|nr:hypothetical protein DFH07DRAFT_766259 [Mycena maculata]
MDFLGWGEREGRGERRVNAVCIRVEGGYATASQEQYRTSARFESVSTRKRGRHTRREEMQESARSGYPTHAWPSLRHGKVVWVGYIRRDKAADEITPQVKPRASSDDDKPNPSHPSAKLMTGPEGNGIPSENLYRSSTSEMRSWASAKHPLADTERSRGRCRRRAWRRALRRLAVRRASRGVEEACGQGKFEETRTQSAFYSQDNGDKSQQTTVREDLVGVERGARRARGRREARAGTTANLSLTRAVVMSGSGKRESMVTVRGKMAGAGNGGRKGRRRSARTPKPPQARTRARQEIGRPPDRSYGKRASRPDILRVHRRRQAHDANPRHGDMKVEQNPAEYPRRRTSSRIR